MKKTAVEIFEEKAFSGRYGAEQAKGLGLALIADAIEVGLYNLAMGIRNRKSEKELDEFMSGKEK